MPNSSTSVATRKEIIRTTDNVAVGTSDDFSFTYTDQLINQATDLLKHIEDLDIREVESEGKPCLKSQACKSESMEKNKNISTEVKKVVSKVNIPFNEKIYKNLVDLEVNTNDLGIPSVPSSRSRHVLKTREIEPNLADYYKPDFSKEYTVKFPLPLIEVEKECSFDGQAFVDKILKCGCFNRDFPYQ